MDKIVGAVTKAKGKAKHDDDFVDRLSHRYTCMLFVVFAIVVSMHQYVGKPVTCWAPKHLTGNHIKFMNSYCWVKNTYYLPFDERIPRAGEDEGKHYIIYYQWIPFILLAQAVFFYLPTIFWHGLNDKAGVDSDNILEAAGTFQYTKHVEKKDIILKLIVNQIDRFLHTRQENIAGWKLGLKSCLNLLLCGCCGKRMGNYLIILFTISKLLFAANVIGQLFILNHVFKTDYNVFGIEFFEHMKEVDGWWLNYPTFPRTTMCDFNVRRLGNVHRYTVQCVLPINLYTEKIYVFLWFWMVFLAICTFLSLVTWLIRFLCRSDRVGFIKNHLRFGNIPLYDEDRSIGLFVDEYLKQDGSFILRLIAHNTNNITTTEICCAMWEHWKDKRNERYQKVKNMDDLSIESSHSFEKGV